MTLPTDEEPGYQSGHILSRNSREGFAERTLKNLTFIEQAREGASPADVHVVTQLVLAMLGLVVIQWERNAFGSELASKFRRALNMTLADFGAPPLRDLRDGYLLKCTTVGVLAPIRK